MNTVFRPHPNLPRSRTCATLVILLALTGCDVRRPSCELVAKASLPDVLQEASGVAIDAAGRTWSLADSGEPVLFHLDDSGRIVREVRVPDVHVRDWEDLAIGSCPAGECFYIGDIGDNLHERDAVLILRAPVPYDDEAEASSVEQLRIRYPDGPSDAEAMALLPDGSLLIITKGRNRAVGVYRYTEPLRADSVHTLEHVQDLTDGIVQLPEQITGASALGERIVLRSYSALHGYEWTGDSLAVAHPPVALRFLGEQQGEGVALHPDGTVIVVGEGDRNGSYARLRCDTF